MLNERQQTSATKRLIRGCGSLEEASRACAAAGRPYSVAQLSRCQTPGSGYTLPLHIIAILEDYCGDAIVSQALFEARPGTVDCASLMDEAAESTEHAASFQAKVRRAIADGHVSSAELVDLEQEAEALLQQARETIAAVGKLRVAA